MGQAVVSLPVTLAFADRVAGTPYTQTSESLQTLQVNTGLKCNLECKHCHLHSGPDREELMSLATMRHCLRVALDNGIDRIDITGGAPELNPHTATFIEEACAAGLHVMLRSNLTLWEEPEFRHFPSFLADRRVEVIASLPYYTPNDTNRQRGDGVFEQVIRSITLLNSMGYGKNPELVLNLVYNPGGAFLPPAQKGLENEYKKRLHEQHGIVFNNLYTITNNPSGRFVSFLEKSGNLDRYMRRLESVFNAGTLQGMMCRNQLSVAWDGSLYDCDFNLALGLKANIAANIADIAGALPIRAIRFADHCYGCTAGSGSSCGGAVV